MAEQECLMELPEQPPGSAGKAADGGERKLRGINRNQLMLAQIDVEHLIEEQHAARGIWELVGQLDLSQYEAAIRTRQGGAGRAAWPPQLLIAIWLYGYSRGVSSARELERQMEYEPGLMWLAGMEVINHHSLSDFRVEHGEALTDLFTQLLVVLEQAGLVTLRLVAHDGSKIRAQAGVDTFRREATLQEKLRQARKLVEEDPTKESSNKRQQAAQKRARRERQERAQAALRELDKIRENLKAEQKQGARASHTEAEARMMKHGDHAMAPSYNQQVSTDADSGVIVGVGLSQQASDAQELEPSIEKIAENLQRMPEKVVADGGYTNLESIGKMAERNIDFYGSLPDPRERSEAAMKSHGIDPKFAPHFFILQPETRTVICPAGKSMRYLRKTRKRGQPYVSYRAEGAECEVCAMHPQCCPKTAHQGRVVSFRQGEVKQVADFRAKMASQVGQQIYRRRGAVAEFPFAWIKERMRLRKFRVWGLVKARMESQWACLAYNVMIWIRKVHLAAQAPATAV